MATINLSDILNVTSVKSQAICREDGFRGPLRDSQAEAYEDAKRYRKIPGNEDKVIEVVDIQTNRILRFD